MTGFPSHAKRQGWQCNMRSRVDETVGQEAVESKEPNLWALSMWVHQKSGHAGKNALMAYCHELKCPRELINDVLDEWEICQFIRNALVRPMDLHIVKGQNTGTVWQTDYIGPSWGPVKYILVMVHIASQVILLSGIKTPSGVRLVKSLTSWVIALPSPLEIQSNNGSPFRGEKVQG